MKRLESVGWGVTVSRQVFREGGSDVCERNSCESVAEAWAICA